MQKGQQVGRGNHASSATSVLDCNTNIRKEPFTEHHITCGAMWDLRGAMRALLPCITRCTQAQLNQSTARNPSRSTISGTYVAPRGHWWVEARVFPACMNKVIEQRNKADRWLSRFNLSIFQLQQLPKACLKHWCLWRMPFSSTSNDVSNRSIHIFMRQRPQSWLL